EHMTYDAIHTPSPYRRGTMNPHAPITPSPTFASFTSSTDRLVRHWSLPTMESRRSLWSRFTAPRAKKHKSGLSSEDSRSSGKRFGQYLAAKAREFIEDYKAEPVDPSLWDLYKSYRKERKLFKM